MSERQSNGARIRCTEVGRKKGSHTDRAAS